MPCARRILVLSAGLRLVLALHCGPGWSRLAVLLWLRVASACPVGSLRREALSAAVSRRLLPGFAAPWLHF
eukprot:11951165-Alexandrium_andersonii.AAC.1